MHRLHRAVGIVRVTAAFRSHRRLIREDCTGSDKLKKQPQDCDKAGKASDGLHWLQANSA